MYKALRRIAVGLALCGLLAFPPVVSAASWMTYWQGTLHGYWIKSSAHAWTMTYDRFQCNELFSGQCDTMELWLQYAPNGAAKHYDKIAGGDIVTDYVSGSPSSFAYCKSYRNSSFSAICDLYA